MARAAAKKKRCSRRRGPSQAQLEQLVEEATVDAYGDAEQRCGLFTNVRRLYACSVTRGRNPGAIACQARATPPC